MRVFCKIQEFPGMNIDEELVCDSVNWLIQNQRADGALPEVNAVIHREMVVRNSRSHINCSPPPPPLPPSPHATTKMNPIRVWVLWINYPCLNFN